MSDNDARRRPVRYRLLKALRRDKPPIPLRRNAIVWTDPVLVAEIEFRGWTDDGLLRHPSFKGLRESADEASVFRL